MAYPDKMSKVRYLNQSHTTLPLRRVHRQKEISTRALSRLHTGTIVRTCSVSCRAVSSPSLVGGRSSYASLTSPVRTSFRLFIVISLYHSKRHSSSCPFLTVPNPLLNNSAISMELLGLFGAPSLPATTESCSMPSGGPEWRLRTPDPSAVPSTALGRSNSS